MNTASFMEAHCLPGRINISETVAGHVKALFELEPRGSIEAEHERVYEMYFLNRLRQQFSRDAVRRDRPCSAQSSSFHQRLNSGGKRCLPSRSASE